MNPKPKPGDLMAYRIAPNTPINPITVIVYRYLEGIQITPGSVVISQCDVVQLHLMKYLNIESDEARLLYGIARLASRINELRKLFRCQYPGARIDTHMEENGYGKRYARYYLHDKNDEVRLPEVCKQLER